MAISTGNSNGWRGRGRARLSTTALAEMNVVPLVDVVLVLLIIFMLTAHVMEYGLDVQAPVVKEASETNEDLPVVTITRDSKLYVNEAPAKNINLLGSDIRSRFKTNAVFVRADRRLQWEQVATVIAALGKEKFDIKLVTMTEDVGK
ncbi:MAG: biopolymer transporter ExbD [Bryobacterales bacterium]|nr:biopolymer transporter ExbD [Bryobacterales bacterium]MBV9401343.1 biopolymer transporter ExbD [Bryobacterales bacterium]